VERGSGVGGRWREDWRCELLCATDIVFEVAKRREDL
jgi:hypothetical protein